MNFLRIVRQFECRRKWQPTPVFLPRESCGQRGWWAAIYGVALNWTGLKRLSSSSRQFESIILWFPGGSDNKASACHVADLSSIPRLGRSPGEGNGNPLQYSCLENPMDRGAWWAIVHRVTKSQTRLSEFTSLHMYQTSDFIGLEKS